MSLQNEPFDINAQLVSTLCIEFCVDNLTIINYFSVYFICFCSALSEKDVSDAIYTSTICSVC